MDLLSGASFQPLLAQAQAPGLHDPVNDPGGPPGIRLVIEKTLHK